MNHQYLNCQQLYKDLFDSLDEIPESISSNIDGYLENCPDCRREWEAVEKLAAVWKPALAACWPTVSRSEETTSHLTAAQIWELAEYDGGSVTSQQRDSWRHMLSCRSCYETVARLRECRYGADDAEIPDTSVSSFEIWERWQEQRLMIACSLANGILKVINQRGNLSWRKSDRITDRRRYREEDIVEQGPLIIETTFSPYQLKVNLDPHSDQKACNVDIELISDKPNAQVTDIRANLYRFHEKMQAWKETQSLVFRTYKVRFPSQKTGKYQLELTDRNDKEIGILDFSVE